MERVDLDALEAALAKATPGPWRRGSRHDYVVVHLDHGYIVADEDIEDDSPERVEADTDAIISAHNALPALIAELRELREEAARARWCEEMRANVSWSDTSRRWRVSWVAGGLFDIATDPDRNAAIDAARGGEVMHMELNKAQASDAIIARIKEERRLQDRKWGGPAYDDKHSLGDWAHLIEQRTATLYRAPEHKVAKQELIEVAALAIAALESLWRNREGK